MATNDKGINKQLFIGEEKVNEAISFQNELEKVHKMESVLVKIDRN